MNRFAVVPILLVGLTLSAPAGAAPVPSTALASPRTLVVEKGKIYKFAQDRDTIAWFGPNYWLHVRQLSNGASWLLGHAEPSRRAGYRSGPAAFALGGKRVVWMSYGGVMTREAAIMTRATGERKPTLIDVLGHSADSETGTYFGGLAADGRALVYGDATVACEHGLFCGDQPSFVVTGGGVHRIVGRAGYPGPTGAIPAPVALAVKQNLIALIPAAASASTNSTPHAAQDGPVLVYDLSGRRLTRVTPRGTAREVAIALPTLAVLVQRADGATVIERYNAITSTLMDSTEVPGASHLATGSGGTVFLVGRGIFTLRAGHAALVYRPQGTPVGLSIEGRRVAWAVNLNGRGRIRALDLPRSP